MKHWKTLEYKSWAEMKARCTNQKRHDWCRYGGRGITFDPAWDEFGAFVADMGARPSAQHSLDRIDNSGNYEKSNCRWATIEQQSRNRRSNIYVHFLGQQMVVWDAAKIIGINPKTVYTRISRGWTVQKALGIE
jgi:hypothetical protein